MTSARPFRQSTLPGRPQGRPRLAGAALTPQARAAIGSQMWEQKRAAWGERSNAPRSTLDPATIAALRGEKRRETRFEQENSSDFFRENS